MFSSTLIFLFIFLVPCCELKIGLKLRGLPKHHHLDKDKPSWTLNFETLLSHSKYDALITLNSLDEFIEYIVETPRNYSTILLLNDLSDQLKCPLCIQVQRNLQWIAKTYADQLHFSQPQTLFFVQILHDSMPSLFERMHIKQVPTILYIPREGKLSNVVQMDSKKYFIQDYKMIIKWLETTGGIKIKHEKNVQKLSTYRIFLWSAVAVALGYYVYNKKWDSLEKFITNNHCAYFGLSLATILVSGHVYNMIEKSRCSITTADGLMLIYPATRVQLQAEAFIVAAIYFAFVLGFIFTVEGRRVCLERPGMNQGKTFSVVGFTLCSFSYFILQYISYYKMGH